MTTKNTKLINQHLPKDYAISASQITGFSISMIRMVKNGERTNEEIEETLLELALKNKRKKQARRKRLAKFIS